MSIIYTSNITGKKVKDNGNGTFTILKARNNRWVRTNKFDCFDKQKAIISADSWGAK